MRKIYFGIILFVLMIGLSSAIWPGNNTVMISKYNWSMFENGILSDTGISNDVGFVGPTLTQTNFAAIGNAGKIPKNYTIKKFGYIGNPVLPNDPRIS